MSREQKDLYFVDTTLLVCVRDDSEPLKQQAAERWLRSLWATNSGRLSVQVLSEYYVVVTQRLRPGLDREQARNDVRDLLSWSPMPVGPTIIQPAWSIQDRYGLSWWDSLIVSAAQVARCEWLLTEDLEHERLLDGIRVIDPFQTAPPS